MNYVSTRNNKTAVQSATAIARGISPDGGLFIPESIPSLDAEEINRLCKLPYTGRAEAVLCKYLTDFTKEEIKKCVDGAYVGNFQNDMPAPLHDLGDGLNILELWHGPTCAFKDLALQILPYLLTASAKKTGSGKIVILVATSGDTGKAALAGFADVENTDIIVFYPSNGVSPMQKLQMDTQEGKNVCVSAIKGNFDDAQSGVKKIFVDKAVEKELNDNGYEFSSANSINWGRLVPQIVYYVSAYCDLLNSGSDLSRGFNVTVPTGNFGNILAAYYAKCMGVPINKLICASNKNNVLTDFINTGVYDRNREFFTTSSPSMDILISSNLERLLYLLDDGCDADVRKWQNELADSGRFEVNNAVKQKVSELFCGGFCDDEQTTRTIKKTYDKYGYLIDTHTAVAMSVYEEYKEQTGDTRPVVIASTASPYKFAHSVLRAFSVSADDEFEALEKLSQLTETEIPAHIASLRGKKVRFGGVCNKDDMLKTVKDYLKI